MNGIWIRSQDKGYLVNATRIFVSKNTVFNCIITEEEYDWLGEYETEQRAIEVLDEIHNSILLTMDGMVLIYDMPKE